VTVFGPEVGMTTTDTPVDGGKVVAGFGFEPGLALRDLRKLASLEAGSAHAGGARWDVIGISLTPGPVPDHNADVKGATRPGWCAMGTLIRRATEHEHDAPVGDHSGGQAEQGRADVARQRRAG
jgi:hypothetical protein